ncbi:MAG: EAL domain-containing protein, partial [Pseudomonadota bacterium]
AEGIAERDAIRLIENYGQEKLIVGPSGVGLCVPGVLKLGAIGGISGERLAALGITFSLDDFGTGYSSLSYLRRLPISSLKIDKSFVDTVEHEASAAAMCSGIINLAHELGMTVVAEGIETDLQLVALRALRCDQIQGYLKSRPLKLSDAEALLADAFD